MAQADVLIALYNKGSLSTSELSVLLGLSRSSVVNNVRPLVKRGFLVVEELRLGVRGGRVCRYRLKDDSVRFFVRRFYL